MGQSTKELQWCGYEIKVLLKGKLKMSYAHLKKYCQFDIRYVSCNLISG